MFFHSRNCRKENVVLKFCQALCQKLVIRKVIFASTVTWIFPECLCLHMAFLQGHQSQDLRTTLISQNLFLPTYVCKDPISKYPPYEVLKGHKFWRDTIQPGIPWNTWTFSPKTSLMNLQKGIKLSLLWSSIPNKNIRI